MTSISPAPTDSIQSVLEWFSTVYKEDDLQVNLDYLRSIMESRKVHIKDFVKNKKPCGWLCKEMSGARSYHESFSPDFTPDVLLRMGIFGGLSIVGIETEIPIEWVIFTLLKKKLLIKQGFPEQSINHFSILSEIFPTSKGDDSRKFFHWFCGYYLGKRTDEDSNMIRYWRGIGEYRSVVTGPGNSNRLIIRQMLLQWGYRT